MEELESSEESPLKLRGLDFVLKSIECEKYKSKLIEYGIDEHIMVYLTASDLRQLDVSDTDIPLMLEAINVLNKTSTFNKLKLSNEEISKLQSNICGQLGSIAIALNQMYYVLLNNPYEDKLIDDYLSTIDAASMIKPYMRAEEDSMKKTLKTVYKMEKKGKYSLLTAAACSVVLCGFTLGYFTFFKGNTKCNSIFFKYMPFKMQDIY
ncbi:uncharacterized protein LOC126843759 [Adelges cooleyi]|uniref:uncharacterized protein LOC126843759 n=1 Tax=Adelges cooleyi TaxID=133065 RepID=UPI0021801083|nr:uncharacterized protein LOC126843759 [Adelges cooleyi]